MEQTNLIEDAIKRYENNINRRDSGIYDYIPIFHVLPRFSKYFPGLLRGTNIIISAGTGVGKTQFVKFLTLLTPYLFNKVAEHKIKYKVLYFALEESKEEIVDSLIAAVLNEVYGLDLDVYSLNSYTEKALNPDVILKIKHCENVIAEILENVDIIDTINNPTGIYKYCREVSNQLGEHHFVDKIFIENGEEILRKVYSHYTPNDETQVLVVVDHLSLLEEEKDATTTADAMKRWSYNYARRQITKHWKWTVINVQQQMAATEEAEYYKNRVNVNKVKPTLYGLADNKRTARDAHQILFLFAPDRFEIEEYMGFDIASMRDNFRSCILGKNRYGISNVEIPLEFSGAKIRFKEL
jgi:replicative DNA helicase